MGACEDVRQKARSDKNVVKVKLNPAQISKIKEQVSASLCKIITTPPKKSQNGFLSLIPFPDFKNQIPVLITTNNILNKNDISQNNTIKIILNGEEKNILINESRRTYTNEKYDITFIEIIPKIDKITQNNFLKIDPEIDGDSDNFLNQEIYIIQSHKGGKISHSAGIINQIRFFNISHCCKIGESGNGCPIISLESFKIIGIHREKNANGNFGTLIKYPIDEFKEMYFKESNEKNNQIIVKINVDNENVNKEIYFFDNKEIIDKDGYKIIHENLNEITEDNATIFINDKQEKYSKYFIPKEKGDYEIKISFKQNFYITDCSYMFSGCEYISFIDLSLLKTDKIKNMSFMFADCLRLSKIFFSENFSTKNVTNMSNMFSNCYNLTKFDLQHFSTRKVNDMSKMFHYCKKITKLDISNFDTKNVENMEKIFAFCENLKSISCPNFNTKSVKNMGEMFADCINLEEINLENFDTFNTTNMKGLFSNCKKLKNLNLGSFNTRNVTNMSGMFSCCENLIKLDLSNFNTRNVTDMNLMFNGCKKLENVNLVSIDTSKVTNMKDMFCDCFNLHNLNLNNFNTSNVTDMGNMFRCCEKIFSLNLSSFDTKNVSDMSYMFWGCTNLDNVDISNFEIQNAAILKDMFSECGKLRKIKLNKMIFEQFKEGFPLLKKAFKI